MSHIATWVPTAAGWLAAGTFVPWLGTIYWSKSVETRLLDTIRSKYPAAGPPLPAPLARQALGFDVLTDELLDRLRVPAVADSETIRSVEEFETAVRWRRLFAAVWVASSMALMGILAFRLT